MERRGVLLLGRPLNLPDTAATVRVRSAAIMFISAEIEIALSPLLQQSGQAIVWTGPLLSAFSAASVIGGLCYGLRNWPGTYRTQGLILLTADAILVAIAALTAANGVAAMAILLTAAGLLFAGVITAQTLSLHTVLPVHLSSTGNSLMYTGSCIGYGISSAAIALFASQGGAKRLIVASCLLTLVVAWLGTAAEQWMYRRHRTAIAITTVASTEASPVGPGTAPPP